MAPDPISRKWRAPPLPWRFSSIFVVGGVRPWQHYSALGSQLVPFHGTLFGLRKLREDQSPNHCFSFPIRLLAFYLVPASFIGVERTNALQRLMGECRSRTMPQTGICVRGSPVCHGGVASFFRAVSRFLSLTIRASSMGTRLTSSNAVVGAGTGISVALSGERTGGVCSASIFTQRPLSRQKRP